MWALWGGWFGVAVHSIHFPLVLTDWTKSIIYIEFGDMKRGSWTYETESIECIELIGPSASSCTGVIFKPASQYFKEKVRGLNEGIWRLDSIIASSEFSYFSSMGWRRKVSHEVSSL